MLSPGQEAAKGKACESKGVCGKNEEVANLQDLLIYACKGISEIIVKSKIGVKELDAINHEVPNSLFMTITNANFDESAIEQQIQKIILLRNSLKKQATGVSAERRCPV